MSGMQLPSSALDSLAVADRRTLLLDLAKIDEPTLAVLGCTPEDDSVFVLDTLDDIRVGNEINVLKAFAQTNYLDIGAPTLVEGGPGVPDVWEVRMSAYGTDAGVLASGSTEAEALASTRTSLWDLCGGRVAPLKQWADLQAAGDLVETLEDDLAAKKTPAKPKPSQFLVSRWMTLNALPIATVGPHIAHHEGDTKVRRKAAMEFLNTPSGMSTMPGGGTLPSAWSLRTFEDEGVVYANHHDLLSALRMGLDIESVKPWPNDVAHRFLVTEELRRAMRSRGFVQIDDFDPSKWVSLRVSLPEFSPEVTGDAAPVKEKRKHQEKPEWPPAEGIKTRVVIILDRARLAYETEPEWENVALRTPIKSTGLMWVERDGPYERKRAARAAARPTKAAKESRRQPARSKTPAQDGVGASA